MANATVRVVSGNFLTARPVGIVDGVDFMHSGVVRRVDAAAGKISLKHGDIKNLDMPPMTMAFKVQDPAVLTQFKAGDKVRFTADKLGGNYTVLSLEPSPSTEAVSAPSR